MHLSLAAVVVDDYDQAIAFFVDVLGFELAEDSPALTNDGRAKRWVVVRPPGAATGLLLARADGEPQAAAVGNQTGGRVSFFLRVDDFTESYQRMTRAGVEFVTGPREEPYGRVAVFRDIAGNKWDLIGPVSLPAPPCPANALPAAAASSTLRGVGLSRRISAWLWISAVIPRRENRFSYPFRPGAAWMHDKQSHHG